MRSGIYGSHFINEILRRSLKICRNVLSKLNWSLFSCLLLHKFGLAVERKFGHHLNFVVQFSIFSVLQVLQELCIEVIEGHGRIKTGQFGWGFLKRLIQNSVHGKF